MQRICNNPGTAVTPTMTMASPSHVVIKLLSSKPWTIVHPQEKSKQNGSEAVLRQNAAAVPIQHSMAPCSFVLEIAFW